MADPPNKPGEPYSLDGIEVVELWEVDLDFAVEEAFRESTSQPPETTRIEAVAPEVFRTLDLFQGLDSHDAAQLAARARSIHAVPGYVLLAPGRLNANVYFVLDGQLRLYARGGDKRPFAIVDIGQSSGLRSALNAQPVDHALIATEVSRLLAVDAAALAELAKRSHAFARKYAALLETYLREDNCLHVGTRKHAGAAAQEGYIDPLTLLHNQRWLDTMLPRLVGRYRMGDKPLSVAAFAIANLQDVIKQKGVGAGMRVLAAVGAELLERTRPSDIIAIDRNRHFLIFLPDGDLDAARRLAGRLQSLLPGRPVALTSGVSPETVTMSLAVATTTLENGMTERELLSKTEAQILGSLQPAAAGRLTHRKSNDT